jgi:hypothetical protein
MAPTDNPPSVASSWVTHSILAELDSNDREPVVEALWRLRVVIRRDDDVDAAPWSATVRYVVESSHRGQLGQLDWTPITAHSTHDQALACIERQARRLGVRIG